MPVNQGKEKGKRPASKDAALNVPRKKRKLDTTRAAPEITHSVPVMLHTFDLELFGSEQEEDATHKVFAEEEAGLARAIRQCTKDGASSEVTVDGVTLLSDSGSTGSIKIFAGSAEGPDESCLFLFPELSEEDELHAVLDDLDFAAKERNLLSACYTLMKHNKVSLECSLRVRHTVLERSPDDHLSSIQLALDVRVSLNFPAIAEPIPIIPARANQRNIAEAQRLLLHQVLPAANPHGAPLDLKSFYSSLRSAGPATSKQIEDFAQHPGLLPTLLPFQKRSTIRLLKFEGKTIDANGETMPSLDQTRETCQIHRTIKIDDLGDTLYFNTITGGLTSEKPSTPRCEGGLLAEEMGLGKTLECLALILLNPHPSRHPSTLHWDDDAKIHVGEVKTTLIVTPTSLVAQWLEEVKKHAPSLKTMRYDGWSHAPVPVTDQGDKQKKGQRRRRNKRAVDTVYDGQEGKDSETRGQKGITGQWESDLKDWMSYVNQYDIVITTFQVLQKDLAVARAPLVRPRRTTASDSYSDAVRPRSPLISVEWARVIMDEVQQVGDGRAAEMMSLVPRLSSLAVSGTPAKRSVDDLVNVLKFLRTDLQITDSRHWKRLSKPGFSPLLAQFFQSMTIRTLKSEVQDELTIPSQSRFVVGINMGRVERHVYDETVDDALIELGLDKRGVALAPGWELDVGLLRSWLRRLRAVATHPQVGQLDGRERILGGGGNLKSIAAVLEDMRDQSWKSILEAHKAKVLENVRLAQLVQRDEKRQRRYLDALDMLLNCQNLMTQQVEDILEMLAEVKKEGETLIEEAKIARGISSDSDDGDLSSSESDAGDEGLGPSEQDLGHRRLPKTPAGEAHRLRKQTLNIRLRESVVVQHKIVFLLGDLYHTLGREKDEEDAYAQAEILRQKLLKVTERRAIRAMEELADGTLLKHFNPEREMSLKPCGKGGIKTQLLLTQGNEIIQLMDAQRDLLLKWRTVISELLTESLSGENNGEGGATGQEYGRSLDVQGEVEQYIQAYAALLVDRREAMVAERTILPLYQDRGTKKRQTRAAAKAVAAETEANDFISETKPEHEVLHADLTRQRKELLSNYKQRALKTIMVGLNAAVAGCPDDHPEKAIVKMEVANIRSLIKQQSQVADKLETELTQFRKAFNERLLYFRQLQEISDAVAEVELDPSTALENALTECADAIAKHDKELVTKKAHLKYLNSLAADNGSHEEEESCIICTDTYESGWMFDCAHRCCETCLKLYLRRHRRCPICRKPIDFAAAQRVVNVKPVEQPNLDRPDRQPPKPRLYDYNRMPLHQWMEIQKVETNGSYGSKIQSMVRHLVWLQDVEPGTKSIVFSAWRDSLNIIEHALKANGIPCVQVEANSRGQKSAATQFRSDPGIFVFLLHGERENAGLNLVEAKRVFCIEPVVNHAFETQAIARIDRLGQRMDTEVYCYYSEDTVERNILDLGVRQGLSLYTKGHAQGTLLNMGENDNQEKSQTMDIAAPRGRGRAKTITKGKGDFVHSADDMLAILFPHLFDDEGYDADAPALGRRQSNDGDGDVEMGSLQQEIARQLRVNAAEARVQSSAGLEFESGTVAGSSRLRT